MLAPLRSLPALALAVGALACGSSPSTPPATAEAGTCTATGYAGVLTPDAARPSADTLLNDALGFDDGVLHNCAQNTAAAQLAACVSVAGLQSHLVGATPTGSALLVHRASGPVPVCGIARLWLFDGTFPGGPYTGVDLTQALVDRGFDVAEGQRITLAPDGLTLIGLTPAGDLQAVTRSGPGPDPYVLGTATRAPFDAINASLGEITAVAISPDGLHLFFGVAGASTTFWEATRASTGAAFGGIAQLAGTASGEINDGTFEAISGATEAGRTLFVTRSFQTHVFTRAGPSARYAQASGGATLPLWFARPVGGCRYVLGTASPGGCQGEGIGWLAR